MQFAVVIHHRPGDRRPTHTIVPASDEADAQALTAAINHANVDRLAEVCVAVPDYKDSKTYVLIRALRYAFEEINSQPTKTMRAI